jgi:hypothetical protein
VGQLEGVSHLDQRSIRSGSKPINRSLNIPSEAAVHIKGFGIVSFALQDERACPNTDVTLAPGYPVFPVIIMLLMRKCLGDPTFFRWVKLNLAPGVII